MKKSLMIAAALTAVCASGVSAQQTIARPTFKDNWSVGVDLGATTPLKGHSFFQNMRSQYGIHVSKQLTPLVGVGVEGAWGVNTTHSRNAFDTQYVGAFGTLNLMNAFGGFTCEPRKFWIDADLGLGWAHDYYPGKGNDRNYIAAKAGLDFNFAVTEHFSIAVKPNVAWRIAGERSSVRFDAKRANFNLMVGFNYNFGPGFKCADCPDYSGEIADLNAQVNAMRAERDMALAAQAAEAANSAALAAALTECQNKPAQVVADTTLNSVRYIFFRLGSSVITADQQPNVEMVAAYMKNHPESKVVIKGYASQDGNQEFNIKLAQKRAEAVKTALEKKYKISPDRIIAEGQGIGHMFSEESWNRVSICTLETK